MSFDGGLTLQNDMYSIQLWARNITNEAIYTGGFRYPFSSSVAAGGDPTLYYGDHSTAAHLRPDGPREVLRGQL